MTNTIETYFDDHYCGDDMAVSVKDAAIMAFDSWVYAQDNSAAFHTYGAPGCGKSQIADIVADMLADHFT